MLDWQVRPIKDFAVEQDRGVVVCNPPYGDRMLNKGDTFDLYRQMRQVFDRYPGWSFHIFTGVENFERIYGRRADKRRKLTNGGMQCNLYQFFGEKKS